MTDVTPRFKQLQQKRPKSGGTWSTKAACQQRASERCQADGLHHDDCPTKGVNSFVVHRVIPARRNGTYGLGNMLWVWNGLTAFGTGGCHEMIHDNGRKARVLGLLREGKNDPWFNVGVEYATKQGFLTR